MNSYQFILLTNGNVCLYRSRLHQLANFNLTSHNRVAPPIEYPSHETLFDNLPKMVIYEQI